MENPVDRDRVVPNGRGARKPAEHIPVHLETFNKLSPLTG